MLVSWQNTLSGRKRCFHFYSEDQPLIGTRITLLTLLPGRMSEPIASLDCQMEETNSDTEWKWNIVTEEMEKNFSIFLLRIKRTVDKSWPDDMNGIEAAVQQNADREAQGRQRKQRYIDYSLKGSQPRHIQ